MKRIFKIIFHKILQKLVTLALVMGMATACFNDPGTETLLNEIFVSLAEPEAQIKENDGGGELMVEVSKAQTSDVSVNYEVTSNGAEEGVDFVITSPNPLVIPAGSFSAPIEFEVTDNSVFETQTRQFVVTITSVSNNIGVQANSSVTTTIVNDDCPANAAIWFGSVSIEDVGYSTYTGTGSANADGTCNVLVINGDVVGGGVTAPTTYNLTPESPGATKGTIVAAKQTWFAARYQYEAAGTYDEETGEILLDYSFYDNGAVWWTGSTVIKPQ